MKNSALIDHARLLNKRNGKAFMNCCVAVIICVCDLNARIDKENLALLSVFYKSNCSQC